MKVKTWLTLTGFFIALLFFTVSCKQKTEAPTTKAKQEPAIEKTVPKEPAVEKTAPEGPAVKKTAPEEPVEK